MISFDDDTRSYLAKCARRRQLGAPAVEAERDKTGFVRALLDATGDGTMPVLGGYRLGPIEHAFSGTSASWFAVGATGTGLQPSARGVEAFHGTSTLLFAPSIPSAVARLVARDRAANTGYGFRIHDGRGEELAGILGCEAVPYWKGFYRGVDAVVDEVLLATDVECASLSSARKLIEAASARGLPITLREDDLSTSREPPVDSASFTAELDPRDLFGNIRSRTGWDGEAGLRLEIRGDSVIQTRLAFGAPIDVRVAFRGGVGVSSSVERKFGSARLEALLIRHRASRVRALSDENAVARMITERGLDRFAEAARLEEAVGAVIAAGKFGGAEGFMVAPGLVLDALPGRALGAADRPTALRCRPLNATDDGTEGLVVGMFDAKRPIILDSRARLMLIQDTGEEWLWAIGGVTLLEQFALQELLVSRCEVAIVVQDDVARAIAKKLDLPRADAPSSDVSEVYMVDDVSPTTPLLAIERCHYPRWVQGETKTLVWAETPDVLIAAARAAREASPSAVFGSTEGVLASADRINVLRRAGFREV